MLMKTQVLTISCHDVDENKRERFRTGKQKERLGPGGQKRVEDIVHKDVKNEGRSGDMYENK
jgi:hypothetical protein